MSAPALSRRPRSAAPRPRRAAPPVLVRQVRNGGEESVHRGDVVEVDMTGRVVRAIGDPEVLGNLRSAVKPFGLVALLDAGGHRECCAASAGLPVMSGC